MGKISVSSSRSAISSKKVCVFSALSEAILISPTELHRKIFQHWLYSTRRNGELQRKLNRHLELKNKATVVLAWERWHDRIGEERVIQFRAVLARSRQRALLQRWRDRSLVSSILSSLAQMIGTDPDIIGCQSFAIRCLKGHATI